LEKIGLANCSRYFLTAEKFDTTEARRIGLIQDHFDTPQELEDEVTRICREIASNGPQAVTKCKQLIHNVVAMDSQNIRTKNYVASEIAATRVSVEGRHGMECFLQKKKANWRE